MVKNIMKESPEDSNFKSVEEVLILVKPYGCFQKMINIILGLVHLYGTVHSAMMYFVATDPRWMCVANSTSCKYNTSQLISDKKMCNLPRSEWQYTEPIENSIVSQFDINCNREWLIHLTSSVYYVGWGFGGLLVGTLADRYGRRIIAINSVLALAVVTIISAFSSNLYMFMACRFALGFLSPGPIALVLMSELVDNKHRPLSSAVAYILYCLGFILLGVTSYHIREWKLLLIAYASPYAILLLFYKFVPESVHWLHVRGFKKELNTTFKRIAYWNKVPIPNDITSSISNCENDGMKNSLLDLFRKRALKTMNLSFGWFVSLMLYFGIWLAADDFGGSIYLNFILLTAAEIPVYILLVYTSQKFGRKRTVSVCFMVASVACMVVAFLPKTGKLRLIRLSIGMLGKASITMTYSTLYFWSMELYTSDIRGKALGLFTVLGRLGGAVSPWIIKGMRTISTYAPFVMMASLGLAASIMFLILPETKGVALKENDSDPENNS